MGRHPDAKQMQNIENILKTRIQNNDANTFLIIVPTDSARLKRQRELVGYHPNRAVANLRVYTVGSFIQRLHNQIRPAKSYISQGIQNLWLHEIVNSQSDDPDAHPYDAFRPNLNISVPDSTLSVIVDKINHFKERGEAAENITANNPTQVDLERIYSHYETKLEGGWVDEQGKHLQLANSFEPAFLRSTFPRVNLVVVEGFTVLSIADTKLLTRIAEMPDIEMWFRTDYVPENRALYKNIGDLVSRFTDAKAIIDPDYERDPDRHKHFAENLFKTEPLTTTSVVNSKIKMLRPADRSEEVEQIASLIQKHVSQKHCKLSDICVTYYSVGSYHQRIAETFPAYGIPYLLIENVPLTKSEVVKSIFSRLSSDRTPLGDAYFSEVEPVASPTRMFHPNEFQGYVDDLLKKGEVVQRILNSMLKKSSEIVENEMEAYRLFKGIVTEFCNVLRSEGEGSYPLREYVDKLLRIARHTNYRNRASTKGEAVKIVQLGELRSMAFDTVFLGDFVEGRFPANYRPDPLLPETPYRTEEEQLHDDRFIFYRVLKSFRERLYLLTPKREREAELIPSPFLGQLKAIATVEEMEVPNPSQGSVTGFLSRYGDHVWTSPVSSDGEFPSEIAEMRPLINHVVKVEKSREKTHEHLAYEGILTAETLSTASQKRLENRRQCTYSVTELETYAKCPFQYFVNEVLRFSTKDEETEDELSGSEKGSLLHSVIFEFHNNRRNQSLPLIGQCDEEAFKDAETQLNALLNRKAEEQRNRRKEKLISENNLFWETDIDKLRVALRKWLTAERANDLSTMPRYFEVNFGQSNEPSDPELSCDKSICICGVQMKGKIDRIDIGIDIDSFNIIDYKTGGSTIRMRDILEGRSLQLPVYLQIAAKLLDEREEAQLDSAAGLYQKIRLDQCTVELGIGTKSQNGIVYENYNGTDWRSVNSRNGQLLDDAVFDALLVRVSGYVQQYVDSISNGTFPLITRVETFVNSETEGDTPITPRNKTEPCNYCRYQRVCRVGAISEVTPSDD